MLADQIRDSVRAALEKVASSQSYRTYVGEHSEQLQQQLSALHGGLGVLLTSSGTAALEIALRGAGIGAGDEVLLSAYDYPGNFWAIERVGARPVLLDVEADGWNVPQEEWARAAASPGSIKGLVVSHLHGQLQPVGQLRSWCDRRGWLLIEDNCQALGSRLADAPTGTQGHFGIASFGGGKVLSAGRGGCLVTGSAELLQKARLAAGAGSGPYSMSELQAAVVLSQLAWLPAIGEACRDYFAALERHLANSAEADRHAFPGRAYLEHSTVYQCGWLVPSNYGAEHRDRFIAQLRSVGIAAGSGFAGFHRRSSRRCRLVGELRHSVAAAARTWVIHHSQALAGTRSAEQVAEEVLAATAALRS